jgi:phosphoesterase RecJ-like protein
MTNFEQLKKKLESPKKIVITAHANPDGDALGSALALYHYLEKKGHRISVIMPTEMPDFLDWMPGYNHIWVYERQQPQCARMVKNADIIFHLDYSQLARVEQMEHLLAKADAYKVMIDHHMYPDDFADAVLWRTSASSTCELIYDFYTLFDDLDEVPMLAFECLYVGLLTDTGRFQHATNPHLFRIVADLTERGLNTNYITDNVTNSYTYKRFKLLGYSIYESLELLEDINTGIIVLDQEDHKKYNIKRGDLEGVVNFILRIRHIKCAILITERKDRVKISMRSKGSFSVQEICSKHFNGGGHLNASGGQTKDSLEDTVAKMKEVLYTEYKDVLSS